MYLGFSDYKSSIEIGEALVAFNTSKKHGLSKVEQEKVIEIIKESFPYKQGIHASFKRDSSGKMLELVMWGVKYYNNFITAVKQKFIENEIEFDVISEAPSKAANHLFTLKKEAFNIDYKNVFEETGVALLNCIFYRDIVLWQVSGGLHKNVIKEALKKYIKEEDILETTEVEIAIWNVMHKNSPY